MQEPGAEKERTTVALDHFDASTSTSQTSQACPRMVLLLLTDPLFARLRDVSPQLPTELAAQISLHLDSLSPASKDVTPKNRTISHELLVRIASWARGEKLGALLAASGGGEELTTS